MQDIRLKQRIARYLHLLSSTPLATWNANTIVIAVTHKLIAESCSGSRSAVSSYISELDNEGYISSGYGQLSLLNKEALLSLSKGSR